MEPRMILFDYGGTLAAEGGFDPVAGTEAVLRECADDTGGMTATDVQAIADGMDAQLRAVREALHVEVHNHAYQQYLYAVCGIRMHASPREIERVFWDASAPGMLTPNVRALLDYLRARGIRTGVISNISFSGDALRHRIGMLLPGHPFEFIIASSEYVFRKPDRRIFDLALQMAGLPGEAVWYCGNDVRCDVEGPSGCGITPVWYAAHPRDDRTPECEHIRITDWAQLVKQLEARGDA